MTGPEQGFLLLSSHLGDPERKVLTTAQLRTLAKRAQQMNCTDPFRELEEKDLMKIGYDWAAAQRLAALLSDTAQLHWYMGIARKNGICPITRISRDYPAALKAALAWDAPGCLWAKGDVSILDTPMVSLVGSRDLSPMNREFAREVGRQAAMQGYTLVSGNARGADKTAQEACLEAGGEVISIVADRLDSHRQRKNVLYLSEDGFDLEFSAPRALSRNRVIHSLTDITFVAQCALETGGTWDGTAKNLSHRWSRVYCFDDGSAAARELECRGARLIGMEQLSDFSQLKENEQNFIDQ